MKTIGGFVAGILTGLVLMGIVGLSFLAPPGIEPISAYCRGFAEGAHFMFLQNMGVGIDQATTDANEAFCIAETPFAVDGWGLKGPLLP